MFFCDFGTGAGQEKLLASGVNTFQCEMQLRLFRHFVPVSVVLLATSDALLFTGAFYQLLSEAEFGTPIVLEASSFNAQYSVGLSFAAVTAMVSVGLYGQQSFIDFRLLFSKIAVASVLVLMLVSLSATYWREGLDQLTDLANFPLKTTLIWLICVSVTWNLLGNFRPRIAEKAGTRPWQWHAGGADRQTGRDWTKRAFPCDFVYRPAGQR